MEKSIRKLQSWYLEKPPEEQTLRRATSWTFNAISKHALDPLKAQASTAMPLVFFASHAKPEEGEEAAQSEAAVWTEVWTEVTPGMEQGIHLYLKVSMSAWLSFCVFVCPTSCLFSYLSFLPMSAYLSMLSDRSAYLAIYFRVPIFHPAYLPAYLSASVYLSLCRSICLPV